MEDKIFPENPAELSDFLKRLGMWNEETQAIYLDIMSNLENPQLYEEYKAILMPEVLSRIDEFSPFNAADESVDGRIRFATTEQGMPVGINPEELMQGTLIVGRPGAGKTTLTYNLIEKANQLGIHSLVLDIKKDYRHLIRKLPNTLVFRADSKDFRWNPLEQPEGVDRVSHITNFADITSEAHAIYDGTNNYIVQHLDWLFKKNPQATLFDLYNVIRNDRPALISRTSRYKESAENRLASILVKLGNVFKHRRGYRIEKLIDDYNIVIELDNLGSKGCIYVSSLILSHIFQYRIANNLRGIKQKPALVIIDEANEIFDKNLERKLGGLTLVSMAREAREFQLGMVCSCQVPDAISDTVKNVYTRVLLNLPEGANLRNMALSMGLMEEERETNFELQSGQAIIRLAGRYCKPFLTQLFEYVIEKNVSNKEVEEHMQPFIARFGLKEEEQEVETIGLAEKGKQRDKEKSTADERRLLMAINIYQYKFTLTQIAEVVGFSACKSTRLFKALEQAEMIKVVRIIKGKGVSKYPVLLEPAYRLLNLEEKKFYGKGAGYEHVIWQHLITEHFKEHKPVVEMNKAGKFIDVAVEYEGRLIAIEMAMSAVNEKVNIEKDFSLAKVDKVVVGCKDSKVLEEVEQSIFEMDEGIRQKTTVCLLAEILKNNLENLLRGK